MSNEIKRYKLIGSDGNTYLSEEKGSLGGTKNGKRYGRLDCPAALRALARPDRDVYIKSRVFFKDENTAIRAGFRPCHSCMPEHYDLWKAGKLNSLLNDDN